MGYSKESDIQRLKIELSEAHEQREAAEEKIKQLRVAIHTISQIIELENKEEKE